MDIDRLLSVAKDRGERYMVVFVKRQKDAESLEFTSYPESAIQLIDEKRYWTRKSRGYSVKHIYDLEEM